MRGDDRQNWRNGDHRHDDDGLHGGGDDDGAAEPLRSIQASKALP
jgi:hypothetical protein